MFKNIILVVALLSWVIGGLNVIKTNKQLNQVITDQKNQLKMKQDELDALQKRIKTSRENQRKLAASLTALTQEQRLTLEQTQQVLNHDKTTRQWADMPLPDAVKRLQRHSQQSYHQYREQLPKRHTLPVKPGNPEYQPGSG